MQSENSVFAALKDLSKLAAFNRWLGLEVETVAPGDVELRLKWRSDFGQYNGFLHAGIVAALIDTACGFAAYSLVGNVLASQFSVRCFRPAVSDIFVVRGRVMKPGKQQIFSSAEIFSLDAPAKPFAAGDAVLVPIA